VPDPLSDLIISSDDSDDDKVSGVPNACLCNSTFLPRDIKFAPPANIGVRILFQIMMCFETFAFTLRVGRQQFLTTSDKFCHQVSKTCWEFANKRGCRCARCTYNMHLHSEMMQGRIE